MTNKRVVVIGAGVGGLAAAAMLAKAGTDVTVLEAHVYAGGCAGTFYHQGYRFDAGATVSAGFGPRGVLSRLGDDLGIPWQPAPADVAMVVHLSDGSTVTRWTDPTRWQAERQGAFGEAAERFWAWQEHTADALWDLATGAAGSLPWPPQSPGELAVLLRTGMGWITRDWRARLNPSLLADAARPMTAHLRNVPERLRRYVDAQLLISAQATSAQANALYGAAALDLARRGVVHLTGGMGAIAQGLAGAVKRYGGHVHYRQQATRVVMERGRPVAVVSKRGETWPADVVIANLPPWNIAALLGDAAPPALHALPPRPRDGWGAFMVYAGVDDSLLPTDFPLHHQVVAQEPLGEGNSIFLSFSPRWDTGRAPAGHRALTISAHTRLDPWWDLYEQDRRGYEARKQAYTERVLAAAERALPGLRQAVDVVLPGTPVTFERFTHRAWGWVGGFPQTSLFRAWSPRLGPNLWLVGDSIFPGQSTVAVALGGMRVAEAVLRAVKTVSAWTRPAPEAVGGQA